MRKLLLLLLLTSQIATAQINIAIDARAQVKKISPYLYGRNNSFSATDPNYTLQGADLMRLRDAGVHFFRESGGNNASKYNWRKKLGSHPDWYNNVYFNNWDQAALTLQKYFPAAQGMWAFPLLGYAARTNTANFADWEYNRSQWWEGVNQNLAGGGLPNAAGSKAQREGDIDLYLQKWSADSAVAMLDHWFSPQGLGLNREQIQYWNMDNEPEIWSGTHDDVMVKQLSAQQFMQRYIELAKKARALYPQIKLVGPVTANEWQWYNWDGRPVTENGRSYPWLEYFIKAIAEEQQKSGIRLLDVLDIHFYPASKTTEDIVQLHRVFFDRNYVFPEANGVKTIHGGYDNSISGEYIFARCNDWLAQYLGADHGVGLALTETGIDEAASPSVTAVWYASTIGEFMQNNVEIFTPWTWKVGMWETLHLMSRYNQDFAVKAASGNQTVVSAYPSVNAAQDSMTIVLVNRSGDQSQRVRVELDHFLPIGPTALVYSLSQLPATETFSSHMQNALKKSELTLSGNVFEITLPAMSVSSVVLRAETTVTGAAQQHEPFQVFPNPSWENITVKWADQDFEHISVTDLSGRTVFERRLTKAQRQVVITDQLSGGIYFIRLAGANGRSLSRKIIAR